MSHRSTALVSRTLYHVGIMTLLIALIWVGVGIYTMVTKTPEAVIDKKILEPISPNIDMAVVEAMTKRLMIDSRIEISSTSAIVSTPTTEEQINANTN